MAKFSIYLNRCVFVMHLRVPNSKLVLFIFPHKKHVLWVLITLLLALPYLLAAKISCSAELSMSMKFSLLIDMKMPTVVGILIHVFISRERFVLGNV